MFRSSPRFILPVSPGVLAAVACAAAGAAPPAQKPIDTDLLKRVLNGEAVALRGAEEAEFTEDFFIEECRFSHRGANMFFSIEPGHRLRLEGDDDGDFVELEITALHQTRTIPVVLDGQRRRIRTRVVEEREWVNGELIEVSLNYFARCQESNAIFYFGEDVCFFEDGDCVGTDGSWLAGVDGAVSGVIMPGTFLLGSRYFQEQAPGIALDRAEHTEMGVTCVTPAGTFKDCVVVLETNALEPGSESEKVYAPGVGLIKDGDLELVSYTPIDDDE